MDEANIKPLDFSVSKGVLNGSIYDILTPEELTKYKQSSSQDLTNLAVKINCKDEEIILPVITNKQYTDNVMTPGVYPMGPLNFYKYPEEKDIDKYKPIKMVTFSNSDSLEAVLGKQEILQSFNEPWVTSTDNATICPINDDDQPEMVAIKSALNSKHIDFDSYAPRFGINFPNNKRQLKSPSATLKFIKTFCDALDIEAELILKDRKPDVPNPMGKVIQVSLTDLSSQDNQL